MNIFKLLLIVVFSLSVLAFPAFEAIADYLDENTFKVLALFWLLPLYIILKHRLG